MSPPAPQLRLLPGGAADAPTDEALVRAYAAGDRGAFGVLMQRHQEVVFRLLRRAARSLDDAKDLTQRAFLQAFEHPPRGEVPFRAWVLRIAINLARNAARDAGRWLVTGVEQLDRERPALAPTHDALERAEAEALTRRAVLALPPRQREVFALRIDAGLSFAEVGLTLGISEGNAKAHFHHAVQRLKEEVRALSTPGGSP